MLCALQRRHEHPAKTIRFFSDDVGHPAVVAPRYGEVGVGPAAYRCDKKSRIDHLAVYAELIHVFDAQREISHLSGADRWLSAHIAARNNSAVHQPVIERIFCVRGTHDFRLELPLGFQHVVPGRFVFDYMPVRINPSHSCSSESLRPAEATAVAPTICCWLPLSPRRDA